MRQVVIVVSLSMWSVPSFGAPDPSGVSTLSPAVMDDGCLDLVDGNRPTLRECDASAPNQQWKATPATGGYYRLTPQGMGDRKCLDIINDSKANNQVTLASCAAASGQHWKLTAIDADAFALTTEWRGAKLCLEAVVVRMKSQLLLTDCAKTAGQRWRLTKVAAAAVSKQDPDSLEVDARGSFDPQFVITFDPCRLLMRSSDSSSRAARSRSATLSCARTKAKSLLCKLNPGNIRTAFNPSRYVFDANVEKDAADAIAFAATSSVGAITIRAQPKSRKSTMTVKPDGESPVSCDGVYATAVETKALLKQYESEDAAEAEADRDRPPMRAPDRDEPAPSKSKPSGSARGRMCSKDKDYQSGSCKMENKTRGRCE